MGMHRSTRALHHTHSKLMHTQGRKSITAEVKIRKFLNNISDVIRKSITAHLPDDMTYNDIVTKSEQFAAANQAGNIEHTKPGYCREESWYTHATSMRSSYQTPQRALDKYQPQ